MGIGAGDVQRAVDPVHRVRMAVSDPPVLADRARHRECLLGAALADRPVKGGVHVVAFGIELGQVLVSVRATERLFGCMKLGRGEEVPVVALADGFLVGGGREALGGVGPDRFEHAQPGPGVPVPVTHKQVLGDEAVERVEAGAGDRLGRL